MVAFSVAAKKKLLERVSEVHFLGLKCLVIKYFTGLWINKQHALTDLN